MDFPDLNHLLQLQKYLWEWPNSRAALMVGAGLSLNSKPLPGVSTRFPTWSELAQAMFDEIYPALPNEKPEQKMERENRFYSSNPLRIASEYEAAFSRSKLESLIYAKIPDSGHQPGEIHSLLLQLPWKDVFTTNYDTLLERTEVPGRAYQPVTAVNGLTTAYSPRIIKLHGSFPSQTPFIITEEDYRTYPKCFAPFVNTVRQSLIENAFVLIGFSGDDPNFLEWTGWIRDELGGHHSPIYLVGPLSLSNVQRSLLTKRGVTPIDLSPVFSAKDSPSGIHTTSLSWFLHSLLAAKPQRPEKWPEFHTPSQKTDDFESPILISGLTEPEEINFSNLRDNLDETTVMKIVEQWSFERYQYPGWLIPTDEMRSRLWIRTRDLIEPLIEFIENWPVADRILLFREINWRLEISMIPLFPEWMTPFELAVNDLSPSLENKTPTKPSVKLIDSINVSYEEITEAWLEIAFALLREARETYDSERWNTLKEKIDKVMAHFPQFTDRYHYDQALWMMWNIDRNQTKVLLAKWTPSVNSPLGAIWKAGLLSELDELSEARSLLRDALREIRKSLHNSQGRNIDLLSLEGWCTYLLFSVEQEMDLRKRPKLLEEFSERWQELKAWDCNPWLLKEYFDKVLSGEPPILKEKKQIVHGFDPWYRTTTLYLGEDYIDPWLPAFACIRLYEQVGIPMHLPYLNIMSLPYLNISGDALINACKWISPFIGFWNPAILIRMGKVKELIEHGFIDRAQIADMEPTLAKNLNRWAIDALKREFSSLSSRISIEPTQAPLLEGLIEFSSRLTFKLKSEEIQEAFSLALEFHRQPSIYSHIILNEACGPWFRRLFEAADDRQLLSWIPELIRFPLSDGNDETERPYLNFWPDPMSYFPTRRIGSKKKAAPDLLLEINESTEWLLERSKSESGEGYRRAIIRLIRIFEANLMTDGQKNNLGILLWGKTDVNGLPSLPDFSSYFLYLQLPAPAEIDVVSTVKRHLLCLMPIDLVPTDINGNASIAGLETKDTAILNWALASKSIIQLSRETEGIIEWSLDETRKLLDRAVKWWENNKIIFAHEIHAPFVRTDYISSSLENLEIFLVRSVLPNMDSANEDEWNKVLGFLSDVRKRDIYLTTALLYVLIHRPSERDSTIQTILDDLSSDNEKAVIASAKAVRHWIYFTDADFLDILPTPAIDELIQRVVFRRIEGIQTCLDLLTLLLIEKPNTFTSEQVKFIVSSLTPWSQATCLPLSEKRDGDFPMEERPELRALLGRLASALSIWLKSKFPDQSEPSEISLLRESYESDPLPEVRRSFDMVQYFLSARV